MDHSLWARLTRITPSQPINADQLKLTRSEALHNGTKAAASNQAFTKVAMARNVPETPWIQLSTLLEAPLFIPHTKSNLVLQARAIIGFEPTHLGQLEAI